MIRLRYLPFQDEAHAQFVLGIFIWIDRGPVAAVFPRFFAESIQLPDIRAQREIASALSHWDLLISNTERLLFNCRQQWFALIERTLMSIPKSALGYRDKSSPYPSSVQAGNPKSFRQQRRMVGEEFLSASTCTKFRGQSALILKTAYTQITVRRSEAEWKKRHSARSGNKDPDAVHVETGDFLISKR